MSVRIECRHCGKSLRFDPSHAGRQAKCPACSGAIKLPTASQLAAFASQASSPAGSGVGPGRSGQTSEDSPTPPRARPRTRREGGDRTREQGRLRSQPAGPDPPEASSNPYSSPEVASVPQAQPYDDPLATRNRLLQFEGAIIGVGSYLIIRGVCTGITSLLLILLAGLAYWAGTPSSVDTALILLGCGCVASVVSVFNCWAGSGLRAIDRSVSVGAVVMLVLGLIDFPVGTLISVICLYLLLCPKGREVLSKEYKDVIEETPQIRYVPPTGVMIAVLVLLAAFLAVFGYLVVTLYGLL